MRLVGFSEPLDFGSALLLLFHFSRCSAGSNAWRLWLASLGLASLGLVSLGLVSPGLLGHRFGVALSSLIEQSGSCMRPPTYDARSIMRKIAAHFDVCPSSSARVRKTHPRLADAAHESRKSICNGAPP